MERYPTVAIVVLLSLLSSGCVAAAHTEWHGTSFVTPPVAVSADLPATGRNVSVRVEDLRTGVAGYEIGSKLTTTWGYEASTIDLKDKSPLANHITQDVVAALRQRGYRSVPMDKSAGQPPPLVLTVRIHVFSLVVSEGDRMDGEALVSFVAIAPASGRRVGVDAVGVRVSAMKKAFGGDYQALFDLLYTRLRDEFVKKLPVVLQE
jgi:hypothetical protein